MLTVRFKEPDKNWGEASLLTHKFGDRGYKFQQEPKLYIPCVQLFIRSENGVIEEGTVTCFRCVLNIP